MRRIGERRLPGQLYRDRPGAYGILVGSDGMLLLVDQEGELQLPGGGIDPGEGAVHALHREVIEETGWRICDIRRLGAFQRYSYLPEYGFWARKVQLIHTARAVRRLGPPSEPGHQPIWMAPVDAASKLDVEGDRMMVRHAIALGLV